MLANHDKKRQHPKLNFKLTEYVHVHEVTEMYTQKGKNYFC